MPELSAEQNLAQAKAWHDYGDALAGYQAKHGSDPGFDTLAVASWIADAGEVERQYGLSAINAAYDDADDAFAKLQKVTAESTTDVKVLTNAAKSWDRFAQIASAMEGLATALRPPFDPGTILSEANKVAAVTSGAPGTTA